MVPEDVAHGRQLQVKPVAAVAHQAKDLTQLCRSCGHDLPRCMKQRSQKLRGAVILRLQRRQYALRAQDTNTSAR